MKRDPPPLDPEKKSKLQKSRPIKRDWAAGNEAQFLSYREAWARIKLASKQKYFLEAVTIEESIVSDRMLSFLRKSCGISPRRDTLHSTSQEWLKHAKRLFGEESEAGKSAAEIFGKLNAWRDHRNRVVHGIVKSTVQRSEDHIEDFLLGAKQAAEEGDLIARQLDRWVSKNSKVVSQLARAEMLKNEISNVILSGRDSDNLAPLDTTYTTERVELCQSKGLATKKAALIKT